MSVFMACQARHRLLNMPIPKKGRLNVNDLTATMMRRLSQTALTNDVESRRQIVGAPAEPKRALTLHVMLNRVEFLEIESAHWV
jgi:hypothetical protein